MADEKLLLTLEQKVVLLEKILDINKQIEVGSRQEDLEIGSLLILQKSCMDRVDKCDAMIEAILMELDASEEKRALRLMGMRSGGKADHDADEPLSRLNERCRGLLRRIASVSKLAVLNIKKNRDKLKAILAVQGRYLSPDDGRIYKAAGRPYGMNSRLNGKY